MDQDDATRVIDAGLADDVSRVDNACAHGSTTGLGVPDDLVSNVQENKVEELLPSIRKRSCVSVTDVSCGIFGAGDPLVREQPLIDHRAREQSPEGEVKRVGDRSVCATCFLLGSAICLRST